MKTLNELIETVLTIFPNAIVEEDGAGEITIATGLMLDDNDNLVEA